MSPFAYLAIALAIFVGGLASGVKYEAGVVAQRDLAAAQAAQSDARQQAKFSDHAAGQHAAVVAKLSNQLGNAREKIALLSGRECLDAGTVSMLNAIGGESVPAASGESAGAPEAAAAGSGIRFATERDTAGAIAACRSSYAEVTDQLNQILDIEDQRQAGAAP